MENPFTIGWLVWAGVTLGGFAVLETIALRRKNRGDGRMDTLSAHVERLVHAHPVAKWGVLVGTGAFFAWWIEHIW